MKIKEYYFPFYKSWCNYIKQKTYPQVKYVLYGCMIYCHFLLMGCETTEMGTTYRMDFRSTPLPVMLNANMDDSPVST
ncbi:MAG: hypothetical protein ACLFR1_09530 [Spirochaetia bacterium]